MRSHLLEWQLRNRFARCSGSRDEGIYPRVGVSVSPSGTGVVNIYVQVVPSDPVVGINTSVQSCTDSARDLAERIADAVLNGNMLPYEVIDLIQDGPSWQF